MKISKPILSVFLIISIFISWTTALRAENNAELFRRTSCFEITAKASNTSGHITKISGANDRNAIVFATQLYGKYNINEVGVWFDGKQWTVYNQNKKPMPLGTRFFILIVKDRPSLAKVHTTSASNIQNNWTTLNDPSLNNNPKAKIIVTQHFGKYNSSPVGVWYTNGKWTIYNEDKSPMPAGTKFNYFIASNSKYVNFNHEVSTSTSGHVSTIDHTRSNGTQGKKAIFYTPNWKSTYNTNVTGAWYSSGKWTIFNQNRKTIPHKQRFNVMMVSLGTSGNVGSRRTSATSTTSGQQKLIEILIDDIDVSYHSGDCHRLQGKINVRIKNRQTGKDLATLYNNGNNLIHFKGNKSKNYDKRNLSNINSSLVSFKVDEKVLNNGKLEIVLEIEKFYGCHKGCDRCTDYDCNLIYDSKKRINLRDLKYPSSIGGYQVYEKNLIFKAKKSGNLLDNHQLYVDLKIKMK